MKMVLYCHYIAIGRPAFLAWTEIQEQYFLISVVCTEEWYKWVHLCEVLVCVIYLLDTDIHKKLSRTITVIRVTLLSFSACISPYLIDYGLFGRYYILLHDTWVLQEADSPSSDPHSGTKTRPRDHWSETAGGHLRDRNGLLAEFWPILTTDPFL